MTISSLGNSQPIYPQRSAQASSQVEKKAAPEEKGPADEVRLSGGPPVESNTGEVTRREIPGSFVVMAPTKQVKTMMASSANALGLDGNPVDDTDRLLGEVNGTTFFVINDADEHIQHMKSFLGDNYQILPNYEYTGDVFDSPVIEAGVAEPSPAATSDAKSGTAGALPNHLEIMNVGEAWEKTKGSPSVVAAITDTGLDVSHARLEGTIWNNPGEIGGNGVDDDGNGYIDDTIGWDVTDNDNDPSDKMSTHHTHVHGIVHAQGGDGKVEGVAPDSKSMVLRIAGGKRGYNTAVVIESYLYALNQGAKSINTSFNIDHFVGDKAIENTYRTLVDNDVLLFNSAGNNGQLDSPRSKFDDIVLVASTDTSEANKDKRSSFSNYGSGVDIAAPGRDIMATLPNDKLGSMSGTSMASPNAMGVDLLVQSAHPEWNNEQRWAQIVGTADNIDAQNPGYEGKLGAGRVNAGRAVNEEIAPPRISAREVKDRSGKLSQVVVRLNSVLDTASANKDEAWKIVNADNEVVQQGAPKEVRLMTNELPFDVSGLEPGSYRLIGSAEHLHDPFNQPLDGDGDGVGGDDFVQPFVVS